MSAPAAEAPGPALSEALAGTQASGLVVNVADGRVLASVGDVRGAKFLPGSTMKPFVLLRALIDGVVRPQTTIPCRGTLLVGGRNLRCTHPRELRSFTAETALAYSCNEYVAAVAAQMRPDQLSGGLAEYGLRTGPGAALGTPNSRILQALGLAGLRVSPEQLAAAYRRLALNMVGSGMYAQRAALDLVQRGLEGSVSYGMANGAATAGVRLAGKTGTASEPGQAWTHGWFTGIVYSGDGQPQQVVVVFVPVGSGAEATALTHRFLAAEFAK